MIVNKIDDIRKYLTPKKHNFYILVANFSIYLVLLVGRGWGAHRMLNYEERIAVGSALSQSLFLSLIGTSYFNIVSSEVST